jgi:hypothetical protein
VDPRYFLGLIVLVVMGWFAFGILYNLRRGEALLRWMRGGLPRMGERTTLRWLGSSVAELVIAKAKKPFRRLETVVVLSPRDVPWLWLLAGMQKRRDTLIFRGQLSIAPRLDMDLIDPTDWTGRMALQKATQRGWESRDYHDLKFMAPVGLVGLACSTIDRLDPQMRQLASEYRRFSLRRSSPHLEIHIAFPDRQQPDADQFFASLQSLAVAISEFD